MTLGGQQQHLAFDAAQITSKEHGSKPSTVSQPLNTLGQMSVFPTIDANMNSKFGSNQWVDSGQYIAWEMQHASEAYRESGNVVPTLQARMGTGGNNVPMVGVRRLTPLECERLQGFPDGWTEGQSDAQRYKQLGNAVAVPVIEWIGKRIMELSK